MTASNDQELAQDPSIQLLFQDPSIQIFNIYGTVSADKAKIKEPGILLKTWFTEGVDDPRILHVKVRPTGWLLGYQNHRKGRTYQETVELLSKTLDDSNEGKDRHNISLVHPVIF
jgi:general stress protein 26